MSIDELQIQQFGCSYADNGIDDIVCLSKIRLKMGFKFLSVPIDFSLLATREQYEHELCVGDMVSLIGFPNVYDQKNNMPVFRNGGISSDPRLDYSFDGKNMAMCWLMRRSVLKAHREVQFSPFKKDSE